MVKRQSIIKKRDKYLKFVLKNDDFFVKILAQIGGHFCGQKCKMVSFVLGFAIFGARICENLTKKWSIVPDKWPIVPVRKSKWYSKCAITHCKNIIFD